MADLPKYHIAEQSAGALLRPVAAEVQALAARTRHYSQRLNLKGEADRAALEAAAEALTQAAQTLARLAGETSRQ